MSKEVCARLTGLVRATTFVLLVTLGDAFGQQRGLG